MTLIGFRVAVLFLLASSLSAQSNIGGGGSGGGTPVPGTFNSSFDPPLFQNYTLTTTGAQTGINLMANPIDTQQISWRPVGFTFSIIDKLSGYVSGDLHTNNNANWVYQTGTFTVGINPTVVYGNAATSLAYRSDGPSATIAEWAEETVVETASNGTQFHGPCVRVSTAAQTGYCIEMANNLLQLFKAVAGVNTLLGSNQASPVTGDVIAIQSDGTTNISLFKNGVLLTTVSDASIASGSTGIYNGGNATANGFSKFQSGTGPYPVCTIALDSSPDGTTWTAGGAIPTQSCTTPGSVQFTATTNNVRVNLLTFSGTNVGVVYSGRLAPAPSNAAPVSNGQWVAPGQVIWFQYTSQGVFTSGVHQSASIILPGGSVQNTTWDVASGCVAGSTSGQGTGFTVSQGGWVQGTTYEITSANIPENGVEVNVYILNSMPPGGGTTSCVATLGPSQIGQILVTQQAGSFLPGSFVGTTAIPTHPWTVPGYTTTLVPSTPAAGAELSFTFSTGARTCIQSVSFTLAAGSTNVNPTLVFTINASKLAYTAATAQTSATTQNYSWSPGANAEAVTAGATIFHIVPFNNGQMVCTNSGLSTLTLATVTTGLNGTTAYTNPSILVQVQQDNN